MNRVIPFFLLILILGTSSFQLKDDKSKLLIGIWKLVKLEIPTVEEAMRTATPEQKAQYKQELVTMMRYARFEFKQDGTYHIIFGGNDERGKWRMNEYGSKLFIQKLLANGTYEKEEQIGVEQLEKNALIILNDYESGEIIRMSFTR